MGEDPKGKGEDLLTQPSRQKTWNRDIWLGLILLGFSLSLLFWLIPVYVGEHTTGERGLTPRFFPYSIVITLAFLSLLLVYENFQAGHEQRPRAEDKRVTPFTLVCVLLFFAYYVEIRVIGMVPASMVTMFGLTRLFGFRRWLTNLVISVVFAILLYLFFEKMAQVSIPRGLLFEGWY
ncbi:MAG: tripartite tricarboxylate transporter TctB family protein [Deltaproteobacteria bacterium]|nr:tripartite tricarboxylate transporter TctB family protein [Deltaproteobacteria bacterium]MBW2121833.1 tripartite tricarboxylate transporter TctB family protein [Deltaproteobacteria bacterium]